MAHSSPDVELCPVFVCQRSRTRSGISSLVLLAVGFSLPVPARADPGGNGQLSRDPESYTDRLIDDGKLEPLTSLSEEQARNAKGNVRSLVTELGGLLISPRSRVEGIDTSELDRIQREIGISVSGRYQTDNYGLLGFDGQLRRGSNPGPFGGSSPDTWNGSIAFTSRDMPLGDGWLGDSVLGTAAAPLIPLVRRQTRFYLPSSPILGGAVTFKGYRRFSPAQTTSDPEPFASFNLAIGEPGLFGGLRLSDFTGLSGLSISGGGQVDLTPQWTAGVQAIAVKDTRDPYAVFDQVAPSAEAVPRVSSNGALGTIAFTDKNVRVQANAIWSHLSGMGSSSNPFGEDGSSAGGWIDASYRKGRSYHSGGLYYFGPGLSWGTSAVINNAYGGYYRFSTSSQRWRWTLNIDAVNSVDGRSSSGVIVNADARRKLNFSTAIGLNSTLRVANGQTSTQILGFVDFSTALGSSRAEAGWSYDPESNLFRVGVNQNWSLPAWFPSGSRSSTQVSFEHRRQAEDFPYFPDGRETGKTDSFGAAASAGTTPFNGISIDATIAYNSNASTSATSVYGPVDSDRRHPRNPVIPKGACLLGEPGGHRSPFFELEPVSIIYRYNIQLGSQLWLAGFEHIAAWAFANSVRCDAAQFLSPARRLFDFAAFDFGGTPEG